MGGIGTAACALHHPARFAAAEPLCGYHSYFVRSDIGGRSLRPWEKFIAEQRSNVFWAENGMYLPLYVVHGTKDLPEENSGVLIDRYTELNYDVTHEHPELGHNVWQTTYEDLKGAQLATDPSAPDAPARHPVQDAAARAGRTTRGCTSASSRRATHGARSPRASTGTTPSRCRRTESSALAIDRDTERIDDAAPGDGRHRRPQDHLPGRGAHRAPPLNKQEGPSGGRAPRLHEGPFKHGTVTGPIQDVFHDPILFVWGASDPAQARANEEVARAWARSTVGACASTTPS